MADAKTTTTTATAKPMTEADAAEMQRQLTEWQQARDAANAQEREEKMAPLVAVIESAAYKEVFDKITAIHLSGAYLSMTNVDGTIRSLLTCLSLLPTNAASQV